ncbi:hypothetical protein EDB19DRAFT_162510 [Suillus lakei]|nr:hypothetical protein EDB19DRAFT_162510 [Suillus lakei]
MVDELVRSSSYAFIGICFTAIATFRGVCSHLPPLLFARIHSALVVMTSAIPGITGYYWSSTGVQFFMPFLLLFIFQLGLVTLTLVRVVQGWRSAKGHLHAIMVKHNIFYYAWGLLSSTSRASISHISFFYLIDESPIAHSFRYCILRLSDCSKCDRVPRVWNWGTPLAYKHKILRPLC